MGVYPQERMVPIIKTEGEDAYKKLRNGRAPGKNNISKETKLKYRRKYNINTLYFYI